MKVVQPRSKLRSGFTMLEVLLATTIFAFAVLAIVKVGRDSIRAVRESQSLFQAVQLAQSKMIEMEAKYQKQIDRDGVKEGVFAEENGVFEAPNEDFKWEVKLKESSMKLNESSLRKLLTSLGLEEEMINQQMENQTQRIVFSNINKAIKENFAELIVTVRYERFARKYFLPLVTHLVPTKVKVTLSTNADEFSKTDESPEAAPEGEGASEAPAQGAAAAPEAGGR
jgi:prepilin-type N-terminal cleavage/methylation domain-containing protein